MIYILQIAQRTAKDFGYRLMTKTDTKQWFPSSIRLYDIEQ